MTVLEGLEPNRVFYFFEQLCAIPHGSRNTKEISDYLVKFAQERNLACRQDESNNVVIWKKGTSGYENAPTVILQGHCDMVTEKTADSSHDFTRDGLALVVEGDYISAKDTTLGGDDGIAVAYSLAILDADDIPHPPLEVIITTDEEIGLLGAAALDTSDIKGRLMLNLDSEDEGHLLVGCAGGMTAVSTLPVAYEPLHGYGFSLLIDGLLGGHSGVECDKNRANANILLGRFLYQCSEELPFAIASLEGGMKDNAIPRSAKATLVVSREQEIPLKALVRAFEEDLHREYTGSDEGIRVTLTDLNEDDYEVLKPVSKEKVIFYLMQVPNGIQKMNGMIPGLVETSTNLGILRMTAEACIASSSIRSSVGPAKDALSNKIQYLTEFLGGDYAKEGVYPAWEYKKASPLRDLMVQVFTDMFGKEPIVEVIHAGLECGLFYDELPGLDCVSFGPDMLSIHTVEEKLCISSTKRMWEYLLKVLESIH